MQSFSECLITNTSPTLRLKAVLDKYFPEECEFESDGMKHCCVSECREDSVVENCRKCHRDRCSNPFCPLGKGILSNKRPEALLLYTEAVKLIEEAKEGKEIVICSAVRMSDGYTVRGHRHSDAIRVAHGIPRYEDERPHGDDQGFITSTNRYVTREEGRKIQNEARIPSHDSVGYKGDDLYSEDLY